MDVNNYQLFQGDCLDILPTLEAGSASAVICDPPYGLSFMGKDWDYGVPGEPFWREVLRVAKPGAHLLAFGGTRTFHRLAVAIEDAGWEIRDTIMWVYGSGFPKSHDVGKAIDREAGIERDVIGRIKKTHIGGPHGHEGWDRPSHWNEDGTPKRHMDISIPATDAARQWDGWGTALKPAWEPIIVARKPVEGTVAENVQKHGTGAINIDACRVGTDGGGGNGLGSHFDKLGNTKPLVKYGGDKTDSVGRWPANVIHDGSDEVLALFPDTAAGVQSNRGKGIDGATFANPNGISSGVRGHNDSGGSAARFFYTAKASKEDRNDGCEGLPMGQAPASARSTPAKNRENALGSPRSNFHPTVKPLELMRYLCKLVTPPGGIILDPFMGSGSTGRAAVLEGFGFLGIDLKSEYVAIAKARIEKAAQMAAGEFVDKRGTTADFDSLPLFQGEE